MVRLLANGEAGTVQPRELYWRIYATAPAVTTKGAASTAVAGRSKREVQAGAVVRCLVGEAPG
jgi:hypothetical protein